MFIFVPSDQFQPPEEDGTVKNRLANYGSGGFCGRDTTCLLYARGFLLFFVYICVCVCVCVGHCNRKLSMPQSPLNLVKKESATSLIRTKMKCVTRQMREHNEWFL